MWYKGAELYRENSDLFGIELVTAGDAVFTQNGHTFHIEPGSAYIKLPGSTHSVIVGTSGFLCKRVVRIDGPLLEHLLHHTGLRNYHTVFGRY
ncbi:MAG: hypothetical protein GF350_02875 [Chitinivibrionales bacterium]|nr:hypothetical protein [Chitinivibrionales bacterium]